MDTNRMCLPCLCPGYADVLIATPQRKGPSERVQRAAAAAKGVEPPDEDEEQLRFKLPAGAYAWEKALASFLQDKLKTPELLLVWLWTIGPVRLLVMVLVLAGAKVGVGTVVENSRAWCKGSANVLKRDRIMWGTMGGGGRAKGEPSAVTTDCRQRG
jgi:hypothetical protein